MTAVRRFLFLDFDGTTHPFRCTVELYFCRLGLLEPWLQLRPAIEVVISSSWREVHPVDEMRGYFSEELQDRIVGVTPVLTRDTCAQWDLEALPVQFEREVEVLRWLYENAPGSAWVALDDEMQLFSPLNVHLVACDGRVGLTQRDLELVDEAFARQA